VNWLLDAGEAARRPSPLQKETSRNSHLKVAAGLAEVFLRRLSLYTIAHRRAQAFATQPPLRKEEAVRKSEVIKARWINHVQVHLS
jgi:hypothetical protein